MGRKSEKFFFDNGRGQKLAGIIDLPDDRAPLFYGVFGPCFTCVKESHGALKICRALAEAGAAMLRFDMTGHGASEGDFSAQNFTTRIADIVAAAKSLETQFSAPKILVGHSLSGTALLSAVHHLQGIETVATVCSPADPAAVIEKFRRLGQMTEHKDGVDIDVLGIVASFNATFVPDLLAQNVTEDTSRISCALAVFHAPHDKIVSVKNAKIIHDRAVSARRRDIFILDDAATHLFEKRTEDAVFIAQKLMEITT